MKTTNLVASASLFVLTALPCRSQEPPSPVGSEIAGTSISASCSVVVTASRDQLTIKCQGMTKEQSERISAVSGIVGVMNMILENKLDPEVVAAKLGEIAETAKPNPQVKTYFCDGMWQAAAPGSDNLLDTKTGGNDVAFLNMLTLLGNKRYPELLKSCLASIETTPGWLTPRLLCGLAYAHLHEKLKAQSMLNDFESKAGPSYDAPDCHDLTVVLRRRLLK
jgi:hypothetical protein